MKVAIIDGYVDEPACLGVPPYISPYPRYVAGALVYSGISEDSIFYLTIDDLRKKENWEELEEFDALFVIGGVSVPGRYLGGEPITPAELERISKLKTFKVIGGPIVKGIGRKGGTRAERFALSGFDVICEGDIELFASYFTSIFEDKNLPESFVFSEKRTPEFVDKIAKLGSFIVRSHFYYPNVICEIETYRGCERFSHCSFCTERFYGFPSFRSIRGIVEEISSLLKEGVKHFRIGRQPNLLGYMSKYSFPFSIPSPESICKLFKEIANLGEIKTLHIDNVNAITIGAFPKESELALRCIAEWDTEGDTAPFGLETADENVAKLNNLKASPRVVEFAVRLVNEVGGYKVRENGTFKLLPGLNFLGGLRGETKETYRKNMDFLKRILDKGYLLKRINIRQVLYFPGTEVSRTKKWKLKKEFERFKNWVREEIDRRMIKEVYPVYTVIENVVAEKHDGETTLARPLGSYPITVRIPEKLELFKTYNILVVGHRERSVEGIPVPLNVNLASQKLLSAVPGVSRKLAGEVIIKRPFKTIKDFLSEFPQFCKVRRYLKV